MTRIVSPEFSLVAACALAPDDALARRAEPLLDAGVEWDRVHALAAHHSVLALMAGRMERLMPGALPEGLVRAGQAAMTRNSALQTAHAHQTERLTRLLTEAGVRSIVLKGIPLARMLYPENPEWRYASDIDLLIDLADLLIADDVMRSAGYSRTKSFEAISARVAPAAYARFSKDYQYLSGDGVHHIDLHFRLTLNPHVFAIPFETLHAQSVATDAGFGQVRVLDGHLLLAHLAWHGIVKYDHALKWITDIVRMRRRLEEQGIDCSPSAWPGNLPRRPVEIAAQIDALLAGASPRSVEPHVRRICREMNANLRLDHARTIARLPREASYAVFQVQMTDGSRARAWSVWRMLVDPRDALTLGGGHLPALVYAVTGPFLALARYLRRFRR